MKRLILPVALLLFYASASAQVNRADAVLGFYWSPQHDAKIEVFKRGNKYFGKLAWTKDHLKDDKNPDPKLRTQNMDGLEIIKNFTYQPDDKKWDGGTIYDPENGSTYKSYMELEGNSLKVRGYIGFSFLGRTEIFTRIKE